MSTKMVSIRIDEDLFSYLQERAEREHRTLSNMIISILLSDKESDGTIDEGSKSLVMVGLYLT